MAKPSSHRLASSTHAGRVFGGCTLGKEAPSRPSGGPDCAFPAQTAAAAVGDFDRIVMADSATRLAAVTAAPTSGGPHPPAAGNSQ